MIAHLAEDLPAGRARPPARRACSPSRCGTSAAGGSCSAATGSARSRCTTGTAAAGSSSAARSRRCSRIPRVPRRLDPGAIPAYLTFGYVPTPRTFYEGIRSLPPGHVLTFEPGGEPHRRALLGAAARGRERRRAAWTLRSTTPRGEVASCLERRGRAAADLGRPPRRLPQRRDRLQRDRRADGRAASTGRSRPSRSASRTATASTSVPTRARWRSGTGTNHHEFVVHPDAVDLVERLVWHHDQPFGDSSAMPTYLLSEVTARHVTVALSGDGGDELFAGYERFAAGLAARRFAALPGPRARRAGRRAGLLPGGACGGEAQRAQRFAGVAARGLPDAYRCWISFVSEEDRDALLDGSRDDWALDDYRAIWQASEGAHPLDRLLDLNLRTYLLDDLLVKADRMSMAHGLEVRSPFLDAELIAYTTRLPPRLKARGLSLKRVLKAAVEDLLPERDPQAAEARLRRAARPLVPRGPARLCGGTLGAPDARVKQHLGPGGGGPHARGARARERATTATRSGPCSRSRCSCGARAGEPAQPGRSAASLIESPRRVALRTAFAASFTATPRRLAGERLVERVAGLDPLAAGLSRPGASARPAAHEGSPRAFAPERHVEDRLARRAPAGPAARRAAGAPAAPRRSSGSAAPGRDPPAVRAL